MNTLKLDSTNQTLREQDRLSEQADKLEALRAEEKKNGSKPPKKAGDTVSISEAARALFASTSAAAPSAMEDPYAKMTAMTRFGTQVVLEAHDESPKTFTMGGLREKGKKDGAFTLATWSNQSQSVKDMSFSVTFTQANGATKTFELKGNTLFTENENGVISQSSDIQKRGRLSGTAGNDILINLEDGITVDGGEGDDIILSVGRQSRLHGGDGSDVITSLGDGARLDGGKGDDALTVLNDTLRHTLDPNESSDEREKRIKNHERTQYSQTVTLDGGDGDDSLLVRPDLFKSKITGGAGMDDIEVGNLMSSLLDAGDGSDRVKADTVHASKILGGDGSDEISVLNLLDESLIDAGKGHDAVHVHNKMEHSAVLLGSGNDVFTGREVTSSRIEGGAGDDSITVKKLVQSFIDAESGNDQISVGLAMQSTIHGGSGNDVIHVHEASDKDVVPGGNTIYGDSGDDHLLLDNGKGNTLIGGEGDDELVVKKGTQNTLLT